MEEKEAIKKKNFFESVNEETKKKLVTKSGAPVPQITIDMLSHKLGNEGMRILKEQAIDVCSNFLAGEITSVFQRTDLGQTAQAAIGLVGMAYEGGTELLDGATGILQAAEHLYNNAPQIIAAISKASLELVKDKVIELGDNYLKKAQELPNEVAKYIVDATTGYFKANVVPMETIMAELTQSKEVNDKIGDVNAEAEEAEKKKNIVKDISYAIADVNDTLSTVLGYAKSGITTITTYMEAGPEWVLTKVAQYANAALSSTAHEIDKKYVSTVDKVYSTANDISYKSGVAAARKVNIATRQALEKKLKKLDNKTRATKIKSKIQVNNAIVKLRAKLKI